MPAPERLVAIISDTHMPKGMRRLPDDCLRRLEQADLIVHAGDFSAIEVVEQLEAIGPLVAVRGNVERPEVRERLPETAEFEFGGSTIAVIHDAGQKTGRLERMRRRFPAADAVIFGHSHIPLHERSEDGFQIFNPGSPTERRRSPSHTMGQLRAGTSGRPEFELVELGAG